MHQAGARVTVLKPNDTSTGGVLQPVPQPPEMQTNPPNLTFVQLLQQMLQQFSGLPGPMVRPDWQPNQPKRPTSQSKDPWLVNWIAFGIESVEPDFSAYVGFDTQGNGLMQRNEQVGLVVNFYGPAAYDNYGLVRDSFQLAQNRATLLKANVVWAYDGTAQHVPELIDEVWYDRWRVVFTLRRQILRSYPILTFVSAGGTIYINNQGQVTEAPIAVEE
jgi:hypothetical protein